VVAFPLVVLSLMFAIQFGIVYHANQVALAAAEEGARAARVRDGSAAAGGARARAFLDQLGGSILVDRGVSASRGAEVARVEVSGSVETIVLGFKFPVRQASEGPVERFRGEP
jgi:Flp pilus assembly protein TadG